MPKSKKSIAVQIKGAAPPKGKCRSGRFWKSDRNRFKSVIKVKGTQVKYEQRLKAKLEMKKVKEFETMLKDKAKEEKEALRQRQIDNKKRREENERKSEIVQVVSKTHPFRRSIIVCHENSRNHKEVG